MVNISATLLAMGVPVANTTPPPPLTRLDVLHFEEHVEGAFDGRLRQPGDARHLGDIEQVLEVHGPRQQMLSSTFVD